MAMLFFLWLGVCFAAYFIRSTIHTVDYKKKAKLGKEHYKLVSVLAFIYWFAWFSTVFFDPYRMKIPEWAAYAGLSLFLAGVFLVIISHVKIKGLSDEGHLRTNGVYSKIRHPMYVGFSLWVIGLPIFTQSLVSLLTAAIWITHMAYWAKLEEKELEKKYTTYLKYKKRTWF